MSTLPVRQKIIVCCVIAITATVLVAAALFGRFSYDSYCGTCGAHREGFEFQIPFTTVALYRHTSSPQSTLLSRTLISSHSVTEEHADNWLFAHGLMLVTLRFVVRVGDGLANASASISR
jgi:hypothetical protein